MTEDEATSAIVAALQAQDEAARARILRYLTERFGEPDDNPRRARGIHLGHGNTQFNSF